jgi:hypothetical protein
VDHNSEKLSSISKKSVEVAGFLTENTSRVVDAVGAGALSTASKSLEVSSNISNRVRKRTSFRRRLQKNPLRDNFRDSINLGSSITEKAADLSKTIIDAANDNKISRRAVGVAIIGAGLKLGINKIYPRSDSVDAKDLAPNPEQAPVIIPEQKEVDFPLYHLKELYEFKKCQQYKFIKSVSDKIIDLSPTSTDRSKAEYALFDHIRKELTAGRADMSDVLTALQTSATVEGRHYGMDLIWQGRQAGLLEKYGMDKLDDQRIKWAKENKIDPRILAIAGDVRKMALQILMSDPYMFLEQEIKPPSQWTEEDKKEIENMIPSAGMIAMLMMTETDGYKNVGSDFAIKHLNPEVFASGPADLDEIAKQLKQSTGFNFTRGNIPGSERGNPLHNLSGGAVGPQFMPVLWLLFADKYNAVNKKIGNKFPPLSPFDPIMGTMLSTLYLASSFKHREGLANGTRVKDESTLRAGYEKRDLDMFIKYPQLFEEEKSEGKLWSTRSKLYKVISKWNPWHPQIIQVIEAAISYEKSFPKKS